MKNTRSGPVPTRSRLALAVACLAGTLLCQTVSAQSYALSNLWTVAATPTSTEPHPFMTIDDRTRGLAYNPATDHLLVVSRTSTNAVYILNADNGTVLGRLPYDSSVISGGNFAFSMIDVTDDGVIYAGNLTVDTTGANGPYRVYRWANETAQPTLAYSGDPSEADTVAGNRRFGDSIALRGTGVNTEILAGTPGKVVALLRTTDGVNFTATKIMTDGADGDTQKGLAWGTGNTFWAKSPNSGATLKRFALDAAAKTGTVNVTVPTTAVLGGPLDIDLTRNLLGIVETANSTNAANHNLRIYDISNPAAPVQVDSAKNFPVKANNGNLVGSVSFRSGKLFALDTSNGILAFRVQDGVYYPPAISAQPASVTLWEGAENYRIAPTHTGTPPFTYQWQLNQEDISGATSSTLPLAKASAEVEGSYRVIISNSGGSVTSATAVVTVRPGNPSAQVTNIWNLEPGTRPYLTTAYKEYGVAINPLTTNVLVLTRPNPTNMIAVLDIHTGEHKHYLNYGDLPIGGNKVTVADDGVVFVCNITTDVTSNPFTIYGFSDDGEVPALSGHLFSGDPGAEILASTIGWGANMDARGGGMETEILLGAGRWSGTPYDANAVSILRYKPDMSGFVANPIIITNLPVGNNNFRFGICWGEGDSFWAKSLGSLMYLKFDRATGYGRVEKTYPTTGARSVPPSATAMAYDAQTGLIMALQNGTPPTPVSVPFYDVSDPEAGPFWVDQELFTTYNPDVEFQGSVSFEAGYAVALGVNNGLKTFKVNPNFTAAPLPVFLSHPADGVWYAGTSPTLTAEADSLSALTYQWYFGTQMLAGETHSSLTLTNITEAQAGKYFVRVSNAGGYRDSRAATLSVLPTFNTAQVSNMWSVLPGTRSYLNTGYFEYGMAFNPANSNLVVASYQADRDPKVIIGVLDALTGADKHVLNADAGIITGGNRWINKVGIADDGVVYAANRTTASVTDPLKVYRWADDQPTTAPTIAFSGDPFPNLHPNKLAGWTMDVRGAGVNTEILLSTSSSNVLSVLKTTDGVNFTPNDFVVAGAPADFARLGISFGPGNTLWVKTWMGPLYYVEYDLAARTGTILKKFETTQFPATITTMAYNDTLKMLAGAARDDQKNIQIFDVSKTDVAPVLLDQELFPTYNPSIEANGALDFGGNTYIFGMNENNGIVALLIDSNYVPPATEFKITGVKVENGNVVLTWEARAGTSYQVQALDVLGGTWQNVGSAITATESTATYSGAVAGNSRFFRVVTQ